jgi:serine protease Do
MNVDVIRNIGVGVAMFAAGAVAQGQDFFPFAAQVREQLNTVVVPFGGTYLGVSLAEIDENRAKELKLKEDYGVEITRVEDGSPAEKAGVKAGDVVLGYNGQRVEGMEQFGRMVRETPAGREVKLTISRDGNIQTLTATLTSHRMRGFTGNFPQGFEMPEIHIPDIPQIFTTVRTARLGIEAESLGPQLADFFGVKEGVLVRSVMENTPAQKAGFKAGDVVTKVDGNSVSSPSELSGAVRTASAKKTYSVELMRDHKAQTLNVAVEEGRSERTVPHGRVVRNVN